LGYTLLAGLVAIGGCGDQRVAASTIGAQVFATSALSPSPINPFSCATCHPVSVPVPGAPPPDNSSTARHSGPIYPGGNLFDVVHRPSWWDGYETTLLDSINYCLVQFMGGAALDATDPRARELYEYLNSVSPDNPSPALKYTVVKDIPTLESLKATADGTRGKDVYDRACHGCHGSIHTGEGKLGSKTSIVPEDTINGPVCATLSDRLGCSRTVVVEKIRHGKFFNVGGTMPLYYTEQLSDAEIADILAYVGL
jgi:thiosulfate dehydrogenase